MKYLLVSGLALMMTAVIYAQDPNTYHLETLFGISATENGLLVDVKSMGCTNSQDFYVAKYETPKGFEIAILKQTVDRCRKREKIISVQLPLDADAKSAHLRILNPIQLRP